MAASNTCKAIVEASWAMPDIHWGYGFPVGGVAATDVTAGGVAATDVTAGGVISPGGVGFGISSGCGLAPAGVRHLPGGVAGRGEGITVYREIPGIALLEGTHDEEGTCGRRSRLARTFAPWRPGGSEVGNK